MMKGKDWGKGWGKGKGKGKDKGLKTFNPEQKVWVGNLSSEVDWKEMQAHFNQAGKTKWVEPFSKGKGKGTGGVAYETAEEAATAIATLNGSFLGGQVIEVDTWTQKS